MALRVLSDNRPLVRGVLAGIFGGILFAMAEMVISAAAGQSVLDPLRVIGSLALGSAALSPNYPVVMAALVGLVIHFMLSALYGAVFAGVLAAVVKTRVPGPVYLVLGVVYAMLLWTTNFLVIAPILFPQMDVSSLFWFGFTFAHAFYGVGLGGYVGLARGAGERNRTAGGI